MDNATAATQSGSLPTAVEARSAPVDGRFNGESVDLSGYKITEPLGAGRYAQSNIVAFYVAQSLSFHACQILNPKFIRFTNLENSEIFSTK